MNTYHLRIAGVRIRILAPRSIIPPAELLPFITEDEASADISVEVTFGNSCADAEASLAYHVTHAPNGEDILRCEGKDGRSWRLIIPERLAEPICKNGNWLLYLPLNKLLLPFGRVIIHASAVIYRGEAYIFSAPSGYGKSTQADIWRRELGAEIINGDKVILSAEGGKVTAHGGPAAGSSGIYKNISAPAAAILFIEQATENRIAPESLSSAYLNLYSETIKSIEDPRFNQALLPAIEEILRGVPVARLFCSPDRGAAERVLAWLKEYRQST